MSDRDERESPSGAMRGSGGGAGSPDMPYPRTDAEDTGEGDGGLERSRGRDAKRGASSGASSGPPDEGDVPHSTDEPSPGDGAPGADRKHGGWGDEGIGGGRAGGTGL